MRSLQLTDNYTLHGLSKEEYEQACIYIERKVSLKDKALLQANKELFFAKFKFDIDTLIGDTDLAAGNRSLPNNFAEQIFPQVRYGDKKSYKCSVVNHWHEPKAGIIIHEDVYSAVECAIIALGRPFAILVTRTNQ